MNALSNLILSTGVQVVARMDLYDEDRLVARPGDVGTVMQGGSQYPTVRFDRTGMATIVDPASEVSIRC